MSEIKTADGTVIVERYVDTYALATQEGKWGIAQLIEELSRAEATVIAQQKRIAELSKPVSTAEVVYGWRDNWIGPFMQAFDQIIAARLAEAQKEQK